MNPSTAATFITHTLSPNKSSIKVFLPDALIASATLLNLSLTDQLYSLSIKSRPSLPLRLATSLIHRFARSAHLSRAHRLLLDIPLTDTAPFNALISGYASYGHTHPAFRLFSRLNSLGLRPDAFTVSSLIKASDSDSTPIAHGVAVRLGCVASVYVISCLVDCYSKVVGDLYYAEKCFNEFWVLDNAVWTAMISGFVWNREFERAREVFDKMRVWGIGLSEFSVVSVLGGLGGLGDLEKGREVHGLGIKMGFLCGGDGLTRSTTLSNAFMSMYCRCGSELDGIRVFDEISEPDLVSWTVLIGAFDGEEAVELFRLVCLMDDVEVNEYTLINVLSSIGCPRLLKGGEQIQGRCCKSGYSSIVSVGNALISMYSKCWRADCARQVFDEMVQRDCVSWNALIAGYVENGLVGSAVGMFSRMRHSSLAPTKFTLASILEAASLAGVLKQAMQIHSLIIKFGFWFDDSMMTGLITTYGKCDGIDESKRVFDKIDSIDVVHLNAMAAAFVQASCHADAVKLFSIARNLELGINSVTLSIILKACSALTALEQGRSLHSLALKSGIDQDNFIGSAIVDIYCKCGSIDDAIKAFEELPKHNLAAWNAMIAGYAQHGCYGEVLDLFEKMIEAGLGPDEITFLGVLYSCCHTGLVKESYDHLNSMVENHGLMPGLEHYACIVDLLGRVGNLETAKRTIEQMPISPDARIWQIFLSACNIHGNVELGKVAARELLELQPENDSAYVLLSNLYASASMWDEVGRMRKVMKERAVSKEPGSSWIQVKGTTHSFFANDTSHPLSEKIYLKLEELNNHMVSVEFIVDG